MKRMMNAETVATSTVDSLEKGLDFSLIDAQGKQKDFIVTARLMHDRYGGCPALGVADETFRKNGVFLVSEFGTGYSGIYSISSSTFNFKLGSNDIKLTPRGLYEPTIVVAEDPTEDGTYTLKLVKSGGKITPQWIKDEVSA